jgi:hypothetical protein
VELVTPGTWGTFAEKVLAFYRELEPPRLRGTGVKALYPYGSQSVWESTTHFYRKYFSDSNERVFVLGINPGRFGAGTSGVTFTDGVALTQYGIPNDLPRRRELSAEFIQEVIAGWGGPEDFYRSFFITAVSPIGFTKDGLNHNYYDSPRLLAAVEPFIIETLWRQISIGARRHGAIVLGTGRNFQYLSRLNAEHRFFESLVPLEHPRYIMQYRRKRVGEFVERYLATLRSIGSIGVRHS